MPTAHTKALAWLDANLGQHEQPPGSNRGPFVQLCQAATWLPGSGWPWCVATWVKAWTVAGLKLPYRGAGAYAFLDWHRQHLPSWVVPLAKAKPGAAIILNIGAGHLATLEHPYLGGPWVQTIDGNWGDKLQRVQHPVGQVRGCVDPIEVGVVPPAKPPLWEIVTSASGHSKVVFVGRKGAVANRLVKVFNAHGGLTVRRHKR